MSLLITTMSLPFKGVIVAPIMNDGFLPAPSLASYEVGARGMRRAIRAYAEEGRRCCFSSGIVEVLQLIS